MKKKLIIAGSILAVIVLIITINIVKTKSNGTFGGKAVDVKVVSTKLSDISAIVSVNGIVEESDKEEVYFDTPVKVTNVLVEKDDIVAKGQKLIELDLDDLYSQLNQAKVSLNIQKITLSKIQESFRLQNTNQLQYAMEQAKSNFERIEKLYNQGAASLVEYQNAKTQYETALNNLQDLNNNNDNLSVSTARDIENQQQQIELTTLKINDLQTKINKLLSQSISPIDGVVAELNVQKGSMANSSVKAYKIINPDYLQVKLEVKEVDILKVKEGQMVEVTGDAFPDIKLSGVVKTIGTIAIKKQGASNSDEAFVQVIISIDNTQKVLKPGISVNANVITETKKSVVIIPFNTFLEDKDGNKTVFVVNNNIINQKKITTGISSKLDLEVTSGLTGNEKIVEDPQQKLKDGMKINIQ